ncbi:uncharacterized protein K02A2.6-like [Uloborus diversus]|uniref:uncharacterized protein K02A2.6-like n=1 Tax=Uloborus diversus TaxID=327109 RepID=UPI00240A1004|nr:uncharacterized protein K02A2.6-like [Uloborus diversus]
MEKRALLLTAIGKKTFLLLRNLLQPKEIKDVKYADIVKVLTDYYSPASSTIMERFRFYNLKQGNEDISTFIVKIKELASKCNFGAFLNDALRDKLVCGLQSEQIQNKLLGEKDVDFAKASELALAMETASRETKSLKEQNQSVLKIHEYKKVKPKDSTRKNFGKPTHPHQITKVIKSCKHCAKLHRGECKFKNATCYQCGVKGHIKPACKASNTNFLEGAANVSDKPEPYLNNIFSENSGNVSVSEQSEHLNNIVMSKNLGSVNPYTTNVHINGVKVNMQIDTGSEYSIISLNKFKKLKLNCIESKPAPILKSYTNNDLKIVGNYDVPVIYLNKCYSLPLIVVDCHNDNKPILLGRKWIKILKIKIDDCINMVFDKNVNFDNASSTVEYFKHKYPNCFNLNDATGILGVPINIAMKSETIPIFCKSRPVPYALRNLVDKELDTLINNGVLYPVGHSKWAKPIVAVPKLDGNGREAVRICGDFSLTVNKFCETQFYPLPSQEEIITSMGSGKYFSKIDLSKAFHQIQISPESQELLTLNTPRGLLRYSKLNFGIKSASFLFQQKMDEILKDFSYTNCYIDDLFIRANTKEECIKRTEIVLDRLNSYNVKINLSKCEFFKDSIQVLGHKKDFTGVHPLDEKCNDIYQASVPTSCTELKSYLGLLGKTLLKKHNILVHFDMAKPIVLQCDASDYGVGAVLCHEFPGGELRPIFFASKTLSKAERNYAQVHKEALAIIFGIKKFNKFLQGQKFTIETDSRPLLTLFGHNKPVPTMVNARMQRWAIILSNYDYVIRHKKGTELLLADALSRLPCKDDEPIDEFTHFICFFSDFENLKIDDIQRATSLDPCLSKVLNYTKFG